MDRKRNGGFTLIELIVVIAILGVLAAVALPRFIDLQTQARQAKLQAAVGAVNSAKALFHAQCLASATTSSGACPSNDTAFTNIAMEGLPVDGWNQYPNTTVLGIVRAAGLNASTAAGPGVDYLYSGAGTGLLRIDVPSPTNDSCYFTYPQATQISGTVTAPQVAIINNNCN